jgi:phage-related baseplate assembly protein
MDGQMMFNSTLSIQNQMPTDSSQAETLSFSAKEVHDPSEYPMTVNVITAKDNEGIMLRYWSDKISDSRAHAIACSRLHIRTANPSNAWRPYSAARRRHVGSQVFAQPD